MLNENLFALLDTQTKALIFWNLFVNKESTAKKIAKDLNKDISTILRTLNKLENDKIVVVSRSEMKRNFNLNFWKLNQEMLKIDFSQMEMLIHKYISIKDPETEIETRVSMFLNAFQTIFTSILQFKVEKILSKEKKSINWIQSDIFSALLVDEEIGKIFHREFFKFLIGFNEKYKPVTVPLDKIKENGFIYFFLGSKIKDTA